MTSGQSQATLRRPPRREVSSAGHDPAKLSASLRDLAIRAHRLVREEATSESGNVKTTVELSPEAQEELVEVHAQLVQLQRRLRAQNLHQLVAYVASLRQRVESHLP